LSAILSFSPTKDGHKVFFTAAGAENAEVSQREEERISLLTLLLFSSSPLLLFSSSPLLLFSLRDLGILCACGGEGSFLSSLIDCYQTKP
jgi:hypothetical protein